MSSCVTLLPSGASAITVSPTEVPIFELIYATEVYRIGKLHTLEINRRNCSKKLHSNITSVYDTSKWKEHKLFIRQVKIEKLMFLFFYWYFVVFVIKVYVIK